MTIYGYARVSTLGQELKEQKSLLKKNGAELIFAEKMSATNRSGRNELKKLLELIKPGDIVLVKKIDRLARSIRDLRMIVDEIIEKGSSVIFIEDKMEFNGSEKSSPLQTMMLNMLGSFAEFERDLIVTRTQEGKAYAKKTNKSYREGRPKATLTTRKMEAYEKLMSGKSYKEVAKETEFSKSTLQRIKRQVQENKNEASTSIAHMEE
nr:recombinase family protein [Carnobacterium maltaromaticum]